MTIMLHNLEIKTKADDLAKDWENFPPSDNIWKTFIRCYDRKETQMYIDRGHPCEEIESSKLAVVKKHLEKHVQTKKE